MGEFKIFIKEMKITFIYFKIYFKERCQLSTGRGNKNNIVTFCGTHIHFYPNNVPFFIIYFNYWLALIFIFFFWENTEKKKRKNKNKNKRFVFKYNKGKTKRKKDYQKIPPQNPFRESYIGTGGNLGLTHKCL